MINSESLLNTKWNTIRLRPGLNGALFAERSGAKKREWKTEKGALKNKKL